MRPTLPLLVTACTFSLSIGLQAQLSHGGKAFGLMEHGPRLEAPPVVVMPPVDVDALLAEDQEREAHAGNSVPFRFGYEHHLPIAMDQGLWTQLPNGDRIWRLMVECPQAQSVGIRFDRYVVPEGALVFLYNEEGVQHGAFMAAPRGRTSQAMDQVMGDRVIIEYYEPAHLAGMGELSIDRVVHGYREMPSRSRGLGDSAECQVNVECPAGDDWRDQIRSVMLINTGSSYCTGTLLNNCEEDATPYVLTSAQCVGGFTDDMIFRFNWDSPECDTTIAATYNNSITGADMLAVEPTTDAALLELHEVPPPYYMVYFSGWDTTGSFASSTAAIHHPQADVKKINRSFSPIAAVDTLPYWLMTGWDEGVTETGSTGCGLWNQDGLLIGNFIQGFSDCDTSLFEFFGMFHVAYPAFKPYLGECVDQLQGLHWDPVIPILHDASATSITSVPELLCGTNTIAPHVTLKNNGLLVITSILVQYGVAGGTPAIDVWNGNLLPGQTVNHQLPEMVVPPGDHLLVVTTSSPNGEDDDWPFNNGWTYPFTVNAPSEDVSLLLQVDNYGSEVEWELANEGGTVLYAGGPYDDMPGGEFVNVPFCLTNGCYTFTITDSFGDGICCQQGAGHYAIQSALGPIYAENDGQYGFQQVDVFCLSEVSVHEQAGPGELLLFPNPTSGPLTLDLEQVPDPLDITLHDGTGRIIAEWKPALNEKMITMDLSGSADGLYLLSVRTAHGMIVRRITVQH